MPAISALHLYPIKSCGGIALQEATITAAGLMSQEIGDREWMVVDQQGAFLTQRSHPRMATIKPLLRSDVLELQAPAMPAFAIPLAMPKLSQATTVTVRVWNDTVDALDCGNDAANWFSAYLGEPVRLVRFHPQVRRIANTAWTGSVQAPTRFSDGFPILLVSEESLADLNEKLVLQGRDALPMNRFRPNIVISGIAAFEEDYVESFQTGSSTLAPVKPCPRCPIPSIDQATGKIGPDPLDILRTYRSNPKVDGGITFGMNAILVNGDDEIVRVGQSVEASLAF
jgi:uncharacterized protein YcbX